MALTLLVNAVLLAIPLGGSVGTLAGIDAHLAATGQKPLFSSDGTSDGSGGSSGGSTGGGSGGSGSTTNNGLTNTQYCELSYGISPPSQGEQYTLNPNQWGVTDSTTGALCMNVTTFNNETYPTKTTAPDWSVTWQFAAGPETQPVHAFPNIQIEDVLPLALDKMEEIDFALHWTYGVGNTVVESSDLSTLNSESLQCNVAVDMFFDSDKTTAQNSTSANFEVMVWFARFGASTDPIGYAEGVVTNHTINGTVFELYSGTNSNSQNVLTWIASETTEQFQGDIYPLITDLYTLSGSVYPSKEDYMGIFQFGTEAFSSNANVTFGVSELSIDIKKS
ncbi:uncharacterized protein N7484_004469 [Penicillium longicatenatum]|uniref:uncharacterized protein n=1 Tax=Penicillium longicatenatum TaxID=1561947 RepID=UPI0025475E82|nr:uncharacterized protein N7484_004469 [Penicillium longicatenatum]KAJ5650746.1 hypothetical protein N7484_004469 [Penicillium longicatenatum]